jgi:hypothetical protein
LEVAVVAVVVLSCSNSSSDRSKTMTQSSAVVSSSSLAVTAFTPILRIQKQQQYTSTVSSAIRSSQRDQNFNRNKMNYRPTISTPTTRIKMQRRTVVTTKLNSISSALVAATATTSTNTLSWASFGLIAGAISGGFFAGGLHAVAGMCMPEKVVFNPGHLQLMSSMQRKAINLLV